MIKHIVLYTLKEDVNKEQAVKIIKDALEPLVGVIPGLTHMEITPTRGSSWERTISIASGLLTPSFSV